MFTSEYFVKYYVQFNPYRNKILEEKGGDDDYSLYLSSYILPTWHFQVLESRVSVVVCNLAKAISFGYSATPY